MGIRVRAVWTIDEMIQRQSSVQTTVQNHILGVISEGLNTAKIRAGFIKTTEFISSENYVAGTSGWIIDGNGDAEFNSVIVRGDIESGNWNGASPANLSSVPDAAATAGFYLDSSAGAAQFEGNIWVGGNLIMDGSGVFRTGPTTAARVSIPAGGSAIQFLAPSASTFVVQRSTAPSGGDGLVVGLTAGSQIEFDDVGGVYVPDPIINSGGLSTIDGTAVPAYAFLRSESTGLYRTTTNTMALRCGGSNVFSVNQSGVLIAANLAAGDSAAIASNIAGNFFADDVTNVRAIRGNYNNSEATDRVLDIVSDQGGAGSTHLFIQANGNVLNTNNSYGAISDRRLKVKSSIKPARSYLDDLARLQVRKYRFKKQKETLLGFIADEVAEVFPGMVETSRERDGGMQSVKTTVLIPMMVTAIQELRERVIRLEQQLEEATHG